MSGPFQTQRGMNEIRHAETVVNSQIKRRKLNAYSYPWICGCSRCCGWASIIEHKPPKKKDIEKYNDWLRSHSS